MATSLRSPASRTRFVPLALAWIAAYAVVRLVWQVSGAPSDMSATGGDLVVFSGWWGCGLCAAAFGVVVALARLRGRVVVAAGWAVAAALLAASALLLLDVVAAILPGLGIEFRPVGALSRAVCAGAGLLVGRVTLERARRRPAGALARTPGRAYAAAYLAVAGCLTRIGAQAWVGLDATPLPSNTSVIVFEAGFLLGGLLLPLSLVHRWGRVWPRWVPFAAGRPVPRRLPLWPATAVSAGLVVYFGLMTLLMIWERLNGRDPFPPEGGLDLPEAFFWISVPAYLVWGLGLAVAARAYARRTRVQVSAQEGAGASRAKGRPRGTV
ncbi:hypothetical protein [Actinomadura flavalba]|uniref:hypothetical protein n=1 Tax=Actinomadura flavalba TaxID=1120938 RepID=UPI0012DC8CB3|nr:hypothetical protein [Actinomadura flavalba]